jgi:hypothetical protein
MWVNIATRYVRLAAPPLAVRVFEVGEGRRCCSGYRRIALDLPSELERRFAARISLAICRNRGWRDATRRRASWCRRRPRRGCRWHPARHVAVAGAVQAVAAAVAAQDVVDACACVVAVARRGLEGEIRRRGLPAARGVLPVSRQPAPAITVAPASRISNASPVTLTPTRTYRAPGPPSAARSLSPAAHGSGAARGSCREIGG